MGIRATDNYKKFRTNQNEQFYVQHVGIGIGNIVKKEHKKKLKNWTNLDPNCHRMMYIPKENIESTQFEFLHPTYTKSTIRVILRSSDDAKHGYNENNPKIIYQHIPRQVNNIRLEPPTTAFLTSSNPTQPTQITAYHRHRRQPHNQTTYYHPYPRSLPRDNILYIPPRQSKLSSKYNHKGLQNTTTTNFNDNRRKKKEIHIPGMIPFTLTPIFKQ